MENARQEQEEQERKRPQPAVCTERWAKEGSGAAAPGAASLLDSDIGLKSVNIERAEPRRCVVSICGSE